jgi:hypothetical protein
VTVHKSEITPAVTGLVEEDSKKKQKTKQKQKPQKLCNGS